MDTTIFASIVGGLFAVFAVWFGTWLNRDATRKAVTQQELAKAAAEFRNEFVDEIYLLNAPIHPDVWNPVKTESAFHIIENALIKHEKAMIKFRHYVPRTDMVSFDTAWQAYKCSKKEQRELDYGSAVGSVDNEKEKRQTALGRIDKLLEFANK